MSSSALLQAGTVVDLPVKGMHCAACELVIEKKLNHSGLVKKVAARLAQNKVSMTVEKPISQEELISKLNALITADGYNIYTGTQDATKAIDYRELGLGFMIALLVMGAFLLMQRLGIANVLGGSTISYPAIFMIGIVASLSTCMALVGGLVLSISSSYAKTGDKFKPLAMFHLARLLGFLLLGGVIGWIGSLFNLSSTFYLVSSIILFLIMLILGLNLLDIFPFLRKFQIRMPKAVSKKALNVNNAKNMLTPVLLGVATFFLPCGFTQSMQFQAIGSGNPISGALIMAAFALGTLPVLSLISFTSVKFSQSKNAGLFFKTAGFLVLLFAFYNFQAALVGAGIINPIF